jgi:acyl carrier protein
MKTEKIKLIERKEIFHTVIRILERWADEREVNSLNEQTDILGELGLDSVAILQVIMEIEKKFEITIKDYELDSSVFTKLSNFIDIIMGKVNEAY